MWVYPLKRKRPKYTEKTRKYKRALKGYLWLFFFFFELKEIQEEQDAIFLFLIFKNNTWDKKHVIFSEFKTGMVELKISV